MNERIQQLAEQAGAKFPFGGFVNYDQFDCEKFAELIVQECACVPTDMWGEGQLPAEWAGKVQQRILKRFGVE